MAVFRIIIAGHVIEVHSVFEQIREMCRKFITDEAPDLKIQITTRDIEKERIMQGLSENKIFPEAQIEFLCLLRKISEQFIDYDILLFHGAALALYGNAFLFTAHSGTGKTVHAIRWLLNNKDTIIVNGDKPFIDLSGNPMVCGSPWAGKEGMCRKINVSLKSIILLERAEDNFIEQISFAEAFPFLLQQVYRPDNENKMRRTLKLIHRMGERVAFWRFRCNNFKDDCYRVAYEALVGKDLS